MTFLRSLLFVVLAFTTPALAQDELVASKSSPQFANLRPMTNGLSSISLLWPLNAFSANRVEATHAGLATIMNGPTAELTAFEAETLREIKSIGFGLTALPSHIMLTMTAPEENFLDGISLMNDLLNNPDFSQDWYARQTVQQRPLLATKTRRPENVMGVLTDFVPVSYTHLTLPTKA